MYSCLDLILASIQNESINFLKELNVENDQITEYEGFYSDEMQQIRKLCLEDMTKIIEKYIIINFDTASKLSLNNFLMNFQISRNFLLKNHLFTKTLIENTLLQLQESNSIC